MYVVGSAVDEVDVGCGCGSGFWSTFTTVIVVSTDFRRFGTTTHGSGRRQVDRRLS